MTVDGVGIIGGGIVGEIGVIKPAKNHLSLREEFVHRLELAVDVVCAESDFDQDRVNPIPGEGFGEPLENFEFMPLRIDLEEGDTVDAISCEEGITRHQFDAFHRKFSPLRQSVLIARTDAVPLGEGVVVTANLHLTYPVTHG